MRALRRMIAFSALKQLLADPDFVPFAVRSVYPDFLVNPNRGRPI